MKTTIADLYARQLETVPRSGDEASMEAVCRIVTEELKISMR